MDIQKDCQINPDYNYTDRFGDHLYIFNAGDDFVIAVQCQDRELGSGAPCISVNADEFITALTTLRGLVEIKIGTE